LLHGAGFGLASYSDILCERTSRPSAFHAIMVHAVALSHTVGMFLGECLYADTTCMSQGWNSHEDHDESNEYGVKWDGHRHGKLP
jgi:hypothetical protein